MGTFLRIPSFFARTHRAAFTAALLALGAVTQARDLDYGVTQRLWGMKYGVKASDMFIGGNPASGLNPTWRDQDADGDGIKNGAEIAAGTNPFSAAQSIAVTNIVRNGSNADLQFPTTPGKLYRIECTTDLKNAGSWTLQPGQVTGDGGTKTLSATYQPSCFYRVRVDELDSDGDGISDWVEMATSLNPNSATTSSGLNDYDYVTGQLNTPNVVTIRATRPMASGDGPQSGTFTVSRTQKLLPLNVSLAAGGTAIANADYTGLPGSVTFGAGAGTTDVNVNPLPGNGVKGSESVTATITPPTGPDPAYALGANTTATVIINASTVPTGTGLLGRYYDNANGTYAHAANFGDNANYAFTRGTPTTTGTIVVTPTSGSISALQIGNLVKLTFLGGNLNNALYNNLTYPVTAKNATTFTVSITAAATLPTNSSSTCNYSIQPIHPPVVERIDPMVNFEWAGGTPNGNTITPDNSPDNYSTTWEGYLNPTTAGSYQFQLDADDKARVLIDLNGNGTFEPEEQVIEHGWDGPAVIGTFKQSASIPLVVPASAAERYRIRVEHVETTGDARCRLQWRVGTGTFANIPQANVYTQTSAMTYSFTRGTPTTTGTIVVTLSGHPFNTTTNNQAKLLFSSGNLFTPPTNVHGTFTVTAFTSTTFTVAVSATTALPASGTGSGYVLEQSGSGTTGWLNQIYANINFAAPPGRIGVDSSGATTSNNGIYNTGTPDPLINPDTFSARWTGQVQPQFTEEYTFFVLADDGVALKINGQQQDLKPVTSTNVSGSTYSYNRTTGDLVVTYTNSILKLGSIAQDEVVRIDPSSGNLAHTIAGTYSYDGVTGDAVIDYSNLTNISPSGFVLDETIELDPTGGTLSPLGTLPYKITAVTPTTFTVNFGTGIYPSSVLPNSANTINIADTRNAVVTAVTSNTFTVNVGANKYPVSSTGSMNLEIMNKPLKDWSSNGNERYVRIPMVGGVRYDIELEYWESGGFARCFLYWASPSQPKQFIPSDRLYPSSVPQAPARLVTSNDASALVGGPFSQAIAGSNGANVTISGNPGWLTFSNGVLSGTPPANAAGDYEVTITVTSAAGTSTSVVNLHVADTGSTIVREYWNGIPGSSVASIPVATAPSGTSTLNSLQAPADFGDDYGTRIRGYLTAPESGNYYFWIAGNDRAELWISNDSEPVNAIKRAWVANGTAAQQWTAEPNQKSPWLALEAGQKYYIEILQKAGTGAGDNLAVGWRKPSDADNAPIAIVPGYALSPYIAPAPGSTPGTLYVATMLAQGGANTKGVGTSTLRLSADETYATMTYTYSNLTGSITSQHIHTDPYLYKPSTIVFDIDTPETPGDGLQPDGTYKWTITPKGQLSAADIIEIIKQGKAYINLHTALYPSGEIRGNYTLANGSRTFSPPPAPQPWTDDHTSDTGATRFLAQTTFGSNPADIAALKAMASYEAWIDDQFTKPVCEQLPEVLFKEWADRNQPFAEELTFNSWWRNSVTGEDQLRQRVAFALSQIHVVSANGPLDNNARALSYFYDMLAGKAFGNFRDILQSTTLTPTMGRYLDMLRNDKPDLTVGRIPNENYAREIKQLFSIGLFRMWPDGTLILNSKDAPIDTYSQREIIGFAHTFTGWDYGYDGATRTSFSAPTIWTRPMRVVPARHFTGPKRILNNEVLPGLPKIGPKVLDPYATHSSAEYFDPAYEALPVQELTATHDQLFNHPNVGPFICRQLIQRLVTSHPSRDYVYRVVQKFNDNGAGVRGDMKAVVKAIFLDYEARHPDMITKPAFGKQREPVLRIAAAARAFRRTGFSGTYSQASATGRTITVDTTTPHKLISGNNVYLDFSTGSTAPTTGIYSLASVVNSNRFTINATGWVTATYNQPANSSVLTVTLTNHWLAAGHKVFLDFTSGTANGVSGLDLTAFDVQTSSGETGTNATFTITAPTSATTRTGNVSLIRFTGSYFIENSSLPLPQNQRIRLNTSNGDHHLSPGDPVFLNFSAGNPVPTDGLFNVEQVLDRNTFTVLTTGQTLQSENGMFIFPLVSQPLDRSGNVSAQESTYNLGSTNNDISQSPLNSPTVFNYFLPDYKFPGSLASHGMTTPEFQETSDTNVIKQANVLFSTIYSPTNNTGLGSFRSGNNSLVLDFTPWIGNAVDLGLGAGTNPATPWTNDENLDSLIAKLSMLFTADQLSIQAKTIIKNHVLSLTRGRQISSVSTGNPCTINCPIAHNLSVGDSVTITGITGGTFSAPINGTFPIATLSGPNGFRVNVNCTSTSGISTANARVTSTRAYDNVSPPDADKRDRLNAILQLLLTSPDFTIQR